jgi:hypothetical protein
MNLCFRVGGAMRMRSVLEIFYDVPDHMTLLDKVDNWNLFCEAWLKQKPRVDWHLVKFEDYRSDAEETLRDVIKIS